MELKNLFVYVTVAVNMTLCCYDVGTVMVCLCCVYVAEALL